MTPPQGELAVVALTARGLDLGRRLVQALGHGEVVSGQGRTRQTLQELFEQGRPLVCILALGIVVRLLGPLARDKFNDPPVVVVDENGKFAISVLGGHVGGANALTVEVAAALGATPVITTASDVLGLPPVDLIGHDWGWQIERREDLTSLAAAVVRGETISVRQNAGRRDWWQAFGEWPPTFREERAWGDYAGRDFLTPPALVITDEEVPHRDGPLVIYRPPTLVLGVGCRRGTPAAEIEDFFQDLCRVHGYSPLSLGLVATATLKAEEPGLREFAASHRVPLQAFGLEELGRVQELPTPSETVRAKIGIFGVAEPAALLAAGSPALLVAKQRGRRVTMALARREGV